ncbi:MAG: DUF4974 domain-containing protein [Odoribacter sp.]
MDKITKIHYLISVWLKDEMSDEEHRELEEWLEEDPKNREWFTTFIEKEHLQKSLKLYDSFHTSQRWMQLEQQCFHTSNQFRIRRMIGYAAAIVVLLIIGSAGYWWLHSDTKNLSVAVNAGKEIHNQAVLIVGNGQEFVLSGIKDTCLLLGEDGLLMINNAGNLSYSIDTLVVSEEDNWHILRIPRGGEYKLTLDDGTQVWLNSSSEFRFPPHFSGTERKVVLTGEAYFQVAKNESKPFIVVAGEQQVQVLGTSFDIMAYPDEQSVYTTLLEGCIKISGEQEEKTLKPGEQSVFKNGILTVQEVNAALYCSWIRDRFVFVSEGLDVVARKLERWYDVEFFFTSEELKEKLFTGSVSKYAELSKVLKMLEMTTNIRFTEKNRTVVIEAIP